MGLQVETVGRGRDVLVLVRGTVEASTVPLLRIVLDGVYARRPDRVEVDLTGARSLDGAGVRTLVAARRRLAARGASLSLRADPALLRPAGLDRVFVPEQRGELTAV